MTCAYCEDTGYVLRHSCPNTLRYDEDCNCDNWNPCAECTMGKREESRLKLEEGR